MEPNSNLTFTRNWKDNIRWWFLRDFTHSIDIFRHDKVFMGIMKAWFDWKHNLVQSLPSFMEKWLCQPLVMNPLFLKEERIMLDKRTRLKWAYFDRGEGGLVRSSLSFSSSTVLRKSARTCWKRAGPPGSWTEERERQRQRERFTDT
mgnify:CR=1 FL=1